MAKARITLLERGEHHAPRGTVRATSRRLQHWVDSIQAMKAANILVPVSWGHQKTSLPTAASTANQSALNAGYLDGAGHDPKTGKIWVDVDAPGLELDTDGNLTCWTRLPGTQQEVKTAIREVSAYIAPRWQDGTGRVWEDTIGHVALVPRPVVHGQGGFHPIPAELGTDTDAGFYLSTQTWAAALATEEDMADEPKPFEDEDEPDVTPPPAEPAGEPPPAAGKKDYFSEVMMGLKKLGIHMPPDTTPENFMERACVAMHAVNEGAGADEGEPPPEEPEAPAPVQPESAPIMMSTLTDPFARRMFADRQDSKKKRYLKLVARLEKDAKLPVFYANELRAKLEGYELATDSDGNDLDREIDLELATIQKLNGFSVPTRQAHVDRGKVATGRPDQGASEEEMKAFAKERAARVSVS